MDGCYLEFCLVLVQNFRQYESHSRWPLGQGHRLRNGGRVVRWSWVNFQCRGAQLVWIRVGQGPTALAVGAGCLDIFTSFSLSLGDHQV